MGVVVAQWWRSSQRNKCINRDRNNDNLGRFSLVHGAGTLAPLHLIFPAPFLSSNWHNQSINHRTTIIGQYSALFHKHKHDFSHNVYGLALPPRQRQSAVERPGTGQENLTPCGQQLCLNRQTMMVAKNQRRNTLVKDKEYEKRTCVLLAKLVSD